MLHSFTSCCATSRLIIMIFVQYGPGLISRRPHFAAQFTIRWRMTERPLGYRFAVMNSFGSRVVLPRLGVE
jgi:hypothetical protein